MNISFYIKPLVLFGSSVFYLTLTLTTAQKFFELKGRIVDSESQQFSGMKLAVTLKR